MKQRMSSHVFDLPVQQLRAGYRSDIYFWRSKLALEEHGLHPNVTMQVFQKNRAVLGGVDEAIAILKLASGRWRDPVRASRLFEQLNSLKRQARENYLRDRKRCFDVSRQRLDISEELDTLWEEGFGALKVEALHDGEEIAPWESVMHITGDYTLFAHLETAYLGVLARRTRVATNVHSVVQAARGKSVLYFPARFDHWAVQEGDGYAAHIAGAAGVSVGAQGEWWGGEPAGTVPHALIASMDGDTVQAVRLFGETYPDVPLVALVDFDNDCIETSLRCARAFGKKLWGVRMDTSESIVDKSVVPLMGDFAPAGVVPHMAFKLREALDRENFQHVKIVVSGGFTRDKVALFEQAGAPVDAYGVGSCFLHGCFDFTADVVMKDGCSCAKVGRWFRPNPLLELVENP